jgi:hypothetical protein
MSLSSLNRKFLVFFLLIVLAAMIAAAGCTGSGSPAAQPSPVPTTLPVTTIPVTSDPVVTETVVATTEQTPDPNATQTTPTITLNATPIVTPNATAASVPAAATAFLKYSNTSYGFTMDYPADWQVIERPVETGQDVGVPRGYHDKVDVVEFYSPGIDRCHDGECVNVQAEVHVEVDTAPPTAKLDDYYTNDVAAIQKNYVIEISSHTSMFKVGDLSAYPLDYTAKKDLINIQAERAYVGVGGKVFVFTFHAHAPYSGEEDQYAKYSGTVYKMFKTFKPMKIYKTI